LRTVSKTENHGIEKKKENVLKTPVSDIEIKIKHFSKA